MKQKPSVTLPASFLAIAGEAVLVNAATREALASDGEIIACHPLGEGFTETRTVTPIREGNPQVIAPEDGEKCDQEFDIGNVRRIGGPPVYRIAVNPAKLAALAAAIEAGEEIVMEFPASPEHPIRIIANGRSGGPDGFLMPRTAADGIEGLLVATGTGKREPAEPKELPPPVIRSVPERKSLEIEFGGRPPKETLEAVKDLGFRYSGNRGTKRGTPPHTWYGPDNPYNRDQLATALGVTITEAQAA